MQGGFNSVIPHSTVNHYFSALDNTTGTSSTAAAYAFSGRSLLGSIAVDRVHIRASAVNDGGAAVAVGVGDGSSIDTGAGDDVINVGAHSRGDTMLIFDADGHSASAHDAINLAVFENVQRDSFSSNNFESLLFDESQLVTDPVV